MIRFAGGIRTIGSANGSSKPRADDRAIINLQWQVYNARQELAQAQAASNNYSASWTISTIFVTSLFQMVLFSGQKVTSGAM